MGAARPAPWRYPDRPPGVVFDVSDKCPPFSMARVAMTGTAAADPVADGAGAQAPATVVPPGMRSGPWNSYDRAQLQDAVMVARLAGASQVRLIRPGYATIEVDLKHEKAAGDRESVQAAERSFIERTVPRKKEELTEEQKDARAAARRAKKARQKKNKAEKAAAAAAASEAERAGYPYAQLRENAMFVMEGWRLRRRRRASPPGPRFRSPTRSLPRGAAGSATWCTPRSLWAPWRRRLPGTGSLASSTSRPGEAKLMRPAGTERLPS